MNVAANIAFPLQEACWEPERIRARTLEVLDLVDLDDSVAPQFPADLPA